MSSIVFAACSQLKQRGLWLQKFSYVVLFLTFCRFPYLHSLYSVSKVIFVFDMCWFHMFLLKIRSKIRFIATARLISQSLNLIQKIWSKKTFWSWTLNGRRTYTFWSWTLSGRRTYTQTYKFNTKSKDLMKIVFDELLHIKCCGY